MPEPASCGFQRNELQSRELNPSRNKNPEPPNIRHYKHDLLRTSNMFIQRMKTCIKLLYLFSLMYHNFADGYSFRINFKNCFRLCYLISDNLEQSLHKMIVLFTILCYDKRMKYISNYNSKNIVYSA